MLLCRPRPMHYFRQPRASGIVPSMHSRGVLSLGSANERDIRLIEDSPAIIVVFIYMCCRLFNTLKSLRFFTHRLTLQFLMIFFMAYLAVKVCLPPPG